MDEDTAEDTVDKKQSGIQVDGQNSTKRPYVKPTVRHERVFETMALSCGKVQATQSACTFVRKNS